MSETLHTESARVAAFSNVVASINSAALLPHQVFLGVWAEFLFCESDRIFSHSFAEVVRDLIVVERATSCCLLNFTQTSEIQYQKAAAIFLEATSEGSNYDAQLRIGGPATGWLFSMDRYGCASDKGEWSMCCEKGNDVAVIGLRSAGDAERFAIPLERLHAKSIDSLLRPTSTAPFPFSRLTEEWRDALVENYGSGRLRTKQDKMGGSNGRLSLCLHIVFVAPYSRGQTDERVLQNRV